MTTSNSAQTIHSDSRIVNLTLKTEEFIAGIRKAIDQRGLTWHEPTVSHDENEGAMEISWWRADKSLVVTVELDSPISYLKVWGPNIHSEMASGENPTTKQLITLWQWLYA